MRRAETNGVEGQVSRATVSLCQTLPGGTTAAAKVDGGEESPVSSAGRPDLASQERREDLTKVLMLGAGGSGKSSLCAQGRPLNLPETNTSIFQLSSI